MTSCRVLDLHQPALQAVDMLAHGRRGALAVVLGDGVGDRGVLPGRRLHVHGLPQVQIPIADRALVQLLGEIAQHGISRALREFAMECTVAVDEVVDARTVPGGWWRWRAPAAPCRIGRHASGGRLGELGFDGRARVQNLEDFGNAAGRTITPLRGMISTSPSCCSRCNA